MDPVRDYINPYSYVGNNPINRIDPTGMVAQPFAPFTSAAMIGFNIVGLNEDPNDYFNKDYRTSMERAADAIADAKSAAEQMAASTGDQAEKEYWNDIAGALQDILNNGWYGVDWTGTLDKKNAGAGYDPIMGGGPTLWINPNYLNDDHKDYLTGFIIHEGAHRAFDQDHPNVYTDFRKEGDSNKDAEKRWNRKSEEFAWKASILYFDAHPPSSTSKTNPKVIEMFNVIQDTYNKKGLDKAIDDVIWQYYNRLYRFRYP